MTTFLVKFGNLTHGFLFFTCDTESEEAAKQVVKDSIESLLKQNGTVLVADRIR